MDDETRVALRALAQQAEWGTTGRGGAEACARRLRELGRALAERLAAGGPDDEAVWARRAVTALADHCRSAEATWSAGEAAELARLREAAVIALAPGPGQADPDVLAPSGARTATRRLPGLPGMPALPARRGLPALPRLPRGRRAAVIGLAAVGCAVLAAVALATSGGGGNNAPGASGATSPEPGTAPPTTAADATTQASGPATTPASSAGSATASTASTASIGTTTAGTAAAGTSRVTTIEMSTNPAEGYPEVQIYGTITTSGTGDVTVTVTVSGSAGQPQVSSEDESGQRSYALSQTLYLQQWCGQKSVTVTVSSGSVSKSAAVPVSGC